MRVDDNSFGLAKPRTKNHICRLARRPRHGEKFFHVIRNFAAKLLNDLLGCSDQGLRLISKKAGRADIWFELFGLERRKILDGRVLLEQNRSHHIHTNIRALS